MSSANPHDFADDLALALTLAGEADLIAMDRYHAQDLGVQLKADKSIVTDADTRIEALIRDHLQRTRPDDTVLGEEFGGDQTGHRVWIIDPIDGTSNFARGVPIWGALISLVVDGVPQVGVVSAPALGRRWWAATGMGAHLQVAGQDARPIHVSQVTELTDATLSYNNLQMWDEYGHLDTLMSLSRSVGRTRAFGDLWAYMLLAEGAIDVVAEFDLKPWDIAALVPVIREAGGTFTAADGTDAFSVNGIVASNGILHDSVLAHFPR